MIQTAAGPATETARRYPVSNESVRQIRQARAELIRSCRKTVSGTDSSSIESAVTVVACRILQKTADALEGRPCGDEIEVLWHVMLTESLLTYGCIMDEIVQSFAEAFTFSAEEYREYRKRMLGI